MSYWIDISLIILSKFNIGLRFEGILENLANLFASSNTNYSLTNYL